MVNRRRVLLGAPALAAAAFGGEVAAQGAYPQRVVKIVVGNAPGGTDDAISRYIAERTTLQELTVAARAGDGVTFASGGVGTTGHLSCTRLLNVLNGKGIHVTYKNNPEGLQALIGGFTQMMFASASEVSELRRNDKLRVIAVASPRRTSNLLATSRCPFSRTSERARPCRLSSRARQRNGRK